ncbi:uncharacterized protein LY89DRAFT_751654 [Mollisia scopiformis]|uniref:Uncharacterized protein n=1 Tax=Mollisia scopiformis TaxID=149040 RepID=A0A194X498_MOLSC|nr:uncharacterized protein LY89DRAFT_751654 [Mollisia scopiformis]KUJ15003.1 hypothetical protein LY89DRAFT_751654 [Mollisia scopiformis]
MALQVVQALFLKWCETPQQSRLQALITRDNILTSESFEQSSKELISFATISIFSGQPVVANRLLEKVFQVPGFTTSPEEQLIFELFWHSFTGRPANTPWNAWDKLPMNGPNRPRSATFPLHVYFILANYLGHREKAREILRSESQQHQFDFPAFLNVPEVYKFMATSIEDPLAKILDESVIRETETILHAALDARMKSGWKRPLHDISMTELLRRFSEAAFFVHQDEYMENDIQSSKDILCSPLTLNEIEDIEIKLGSLPTDIKEIALVADGFHGGWDFAGGWPGIQRLHKDCAAEYETFLGYDPPPVQETQTIYRLDGSTYEVTVNVIRSSTREECLKRGWGDVLVGERGRECEEFVHVLCPPSVWEKYQESKGIRVKQGEYAYVSYDHLTEGGEEVYGSVRAWIAAETLDLERYVAVGIRAERLE